MWCDVMWCDAMRCDAMQCNAVCIVVSLAPVCNLCHGLSRLTYRVNKFNSSHCSIITSRVPSRHRTRNPIPSRRFERSRTLGRMTRDRPSTEVNPSSPWPCSEWNDWAERTREETGLGIRAMMTARWMNPNWIWSETERGKHRTWKNWKWWPTMVGPPSMDVISPSPSL